MTKILEKYFVQISLSIIIIIAFIISLNQISQPMIAEGDAYSRALISKRQAIEHGFINFQEYGTWLPFHFSILTIPQLMGFDAFYGQRLVTVIISLLSAISLYFYTKECLNDKKTAVIATIIYIIFPLRLLLSTQTLSESVFLFFLITSIYFLIKKGNQNKNLSLSLLFLFISQATRYEAWIIIPLLWFYVLIENKFNTKTKLIFLLTSIIFPIYWIINSSIRSNSNIFSFFDEKYKMAQKDLVVEYYNLNLSYKAWEKQLIKVFPIPYLLIAFTEYRDFYIKINPKKIIFYFTPIYLFIMLVAQVYFGTMEWFPIRYLLIPTAFIIPVLAKSIKRITDEINNLIKNETRNVYLFFITIIFLGLVGLLSAIYQQTYEETKYFLTTESFLSSSIEKPKNIESSSYYQDFMSVKNILSLRNLEFFEFYIRDYNQSWNDQALFYFLNIDGIAGSKKSFLEIHRDKSIFVWEREIDLKENYWLDEFIIIYENNSFYILEYNPEKVILKDSLSRM